MSLLTPQPPYLDTTPPEAAYKIGAPLDWQLLSGRGCNGDVKQTPVTAQPGSNGSIQGVSFFVPAQGSSLAAIHKYLSKSEFVGVRTDPNTPLPATLRIVNDTPLNLKLMDETVVCCGQHWTLYTTVDCSAQEFQGLFDAVMQHVYTAHQRTMLST